ncbi:MAG: TRAP transporter small permease [bacterium]
MNQIRKAVDRILECALVLLMVFMVVNVIWQVLTRFVLHDPSSYTEELARYLLIWLGLLGAGYCVGQKSHLAIDIVTSQLSGYSKITSSLFGHLVILLFSGSVLILGGLKLVWTTLAYQQISAALQIPLGYVYLAIPISGILIVFYSVHSLLDEISALVSWSRQGSA